MKFVEINYQGNLKGTDFMWGVHVDGCADIDKEVVRTFHAAADKSHVSTSHEADTMRQLLDAIVDGESRDLGWGDDNVKVHNCVTKAFRSVKTGLTGTPANTKSTKSDTLDGAVTSSVAAKIQAKMAKERRDKVNKARQEIDAADEVKFEQSDREAEAEREVVRNRRTISERSGKRHVINDLVRKTHKEKETTMATATKTKKATKKTKATREINKVDDKALATLVKKFDSADASATGVIKAIRASGVSARGKRVRDLFAKIHKAPKASKNGKAAK